MFIEGVVNHIRLNKRRDDDEGYLVLTIIDPDNQTTKVLYLWKDSDLLGQIGLDCTHIDDKIYDSVRAKLENKKFCFHVRVSSKSGVSSVYCIADKRVNIEDNEVTALNTSNLENDESVGSIDESLLNIVIPSTSKTHDENNNDVVYLDSHCLRIKQLEIERIGKEIELERLKQTKKRNLQEATFENVKKKAAK